MNLTPIIKLAYRSTGHWAFVMGTLPRTRFQTRSTGSRARFRTLVMNATLATGLIALAIASLVLGMARTSAKVLTIQRALARVLGVVYAIDWPRTDLVDVQVQLLTFPTPVVAPLRTAAHWLVTQFRAGGGGWVPVASNLFRMFAVRELLQDHFLTLDRLQVLEQVAKNDESSQQVCR